MSFSPFPAPPGPPGQLPPTKYIPETIMEESVNFYNRLNNLSIIQSNMPRSNKGIINTLNHNLSQINKWLNYEIDDKELYENIIEDEI